MRLELARELIEKGSRLREQGDYELAADLYRRSLELHPMPEAHTGLGAAYRGLGRLDDAIQECEKAIALDPEFGGSYNDIGACLIEMGRPEEAVEWLEKATRHTHRRGCHLPWYNLGRVWAARELFNRARECFETAVEIEPDYRPALEALARIRRLVQ
ncbi:MAG: tetratricopeptide repeat protein [Acidobacteria bacterium]|nr:tetratricopeptide repeat protein [Acidobacteriota bacterium]